MRDSKLLVLAAIVCAVIAGTACSQKAADETTNGPAVTAEEPNAADKALDATEEAADDAIDETKEIASAVGNKTGDVVSTTGEAITDGWITTKVSAKFVDEDLLKGSNINVDTDNHVVTLKGTVTSREAKARAAAIAGGTEGVRRVVNHIVVM